VEEVRVRVLLLGVRHPQVAALHHPAQAAKQRLVQASPLDSGAPMPAAQEFHIQLVDAQLQEYLQYYLVLV
jgi:flagellar biogenesis protein FliO